MRSEVVHESVVITNVETGDRGPGTGDRGPGTRDRGTGTGERGPRNGERGTGNGKRGTGNGERGTGNRERESGNECTAVTRLIIQNGGRRKIRGNNLGKYEEVSRL